MYSIGDFLNTNDGVTGIQSLAVYYDALLLNIVAYDAELDLHFGHVLIDKLVWDYDNAKYLSVDSGIMMNLGEISPGDYDTNQLIGTTLLAKPKKLLISTISKTDSSFILNIYEYDFNRHSVKKVYPVDTDTINEWGAFTTLGQLSPTQKPLLYCYDEDKFDILVSTENMINIFGFSYMDTVSLDNVISRSQDLPENIVVKTFSRDSSNNITLFVEKDNSILPIRL